MRALFFILLFGLSLNMSLAQCEGGSVNMLLGELASNDFSKKYLDNQTLPYNLSGSLEIFKYKISKKGILVKNRKVSQSLICSEIDQIQLLISQIGNVSQKLSKLDSTFPKYERVIVSIGSIKNQKLSLLNMRENLDSVKTIKGLTSFLNKNQYFSGILEQSFNLKIEQTEYFADYLLKKQELDFDQFKFTLDYIPLLIEKRELQNRLAMELTSLNIKLNYYQLKNYSYIKYF